MKSKSKKTFRRQAATVWLPPFFLLLVFSACYGPDKGCLDIAATNFNASADENCCCTYPLLKANILHRVNDSTPLTLGAFYPNGLGDSFALLDFSYYLSDFQVFRQNEVFHVADTVHLGILQGLDTVYVPFRSDILAVKRNDASVRSIDTFPFQGIFTDIRFRMGLKDSLAAVLFYKTPSGHPLGTGNKGLYDADTKQYAGMRLTLARVLPTGGTDTLELDFTSEELPADIQKFAAGQIEQRTGFDLIFTIKVDYSLWMNGADMQADKSVIKDKILQNIVTGITVY